MKLRYVIVLVLCVFVTTLFFRNDQANRKLIDIETEVEKTKAELQQIHYFLEHIEQLKTEITDFETYVLKNQIDLIMLESFKSNPELFDWYLEKYYEHEK